MEKQTVFYFVHIGPPYAEFWLCKAARVKRYHVTIWILTLEVESRLKIFVK